MSFFKRIPEGGQFPSPFYGVAWDEWGPHGVSVVCAPLPLNLVLSWTRKLYWKARINLPGRQTALEAEYLRGRYDALGLTKRT